ncbi:hypothetical protein [Pasteurella multocida]|uniref:hypothetical protein n=1 Tax=Pasteurella multocida TaxID=747 RepID=UPI000F709F04|nr:hypothetical protein [Pasteurella multocida]VEJ14772.1 Uncharacterised protein [Pasteurella multocida subsp. septica]HEA3246609.1 hypothetical protein [Pasteurella multocida]
MHYFSKKYLCYILIFSFIIFPLTCYLLWLKDSTDIRWYPFDFSASAEKTIVYKTTYPTWREKCIEMAIEIRERKDIHYYDAYYSYPRIRYSEFFDMTMEDFRTAMQDKPKMLIQIYQDDILMREYPLYFFYKHGIGHIDVNNEDYFVSLVKSISEPGVKACYHFSPFSTYKIKFINLVPISIAKDRKHFLSIRPTRVR